MKKILLLCLSAIVSSAVFAQTKYNLTYTPGVGNPGGLNTDADDAVATWTTIINPSIAENQWSVNVAIPFTFNYYGNPVTNFKVSANGLITFSTTTSMLPNDNVALPTAALPDSTIACFWDGFTTAPPTASNDYVVWKVLGSAPNRQLWIKWVSFEIGAPKADNATFMCMLEETTDKIYLVEGAYSIAAQTYTTTAGIQLNSSTALMYKTANRTRPATTTAYADNNVLAFTPYSTTNMAFGSAKISQPIVSNIPKNGLNEAIMRIDIDMTGELLPLNLTQISLTTSGTTNDADIVNARVFYGGGDSSFSTSTQFGSTVLSPTGSFDVNGAQQLVTGKNYFWVAYSISNTAAAMNSIDATCTLLTIGGLFQNSFLGAPMGSRTISNGLSGTINVGTGNSYEYLSDVFKQININGLSGNTTLAITSDITDTAIASLTYTSGNNYSIKIVPSADVVRNIIARFNSTYFELSGSKNVVIDGKGPISGTGKYLRFLNKDELGSTFNFINGARYDTIRNCVIEGATYPLTKGVITLGASIDGTNGVRDIQFLNNEIRNRSDSLGVPSVLIYSAGTSALNNGNFIIDSNNMFNFRRSAVFIASGDVNSGSFKITNNHMFYNTVNVLPNGDIYAIMFIPGENSENNIISGNYIGGQAPYCGGSAWTSINDVNWVGMNINAGFVTGTSVQGNTIQNLSITPTTVKDFVAIRFESGKVDIGTITGNLIGHPTTPNSITTNLALTLPIYSIYGLGEFNIKNNTIANITALGTGSGSAIRGITSQRGGGSMNISGNALFKLTTSGTQTGTTTNVLIGIGLLSSAEYNAIVRNNKIYTISTTNTTLNLQPSGITLDVTSLNGIIEGNVIYEINNPSSGATASINGMHIQGGAKNWTIRNNMISLTNGANTNTMLVRGIVDNASGNTNNYYNNTVYVGGSVASGAASSYAFARLAASAISIRNNIFYNERSGGTGVHAAIGNIATTATSNWTNNTSGYNLLISKSSSSIGAWSNVLTPQSFAQWQTTSTGDNTSWSDTVANIPSSTFFKSLVTGDLSIDSSNALCWYANGKGIALANISTDMHGQSRNITIASGPQDIGADEFPTATTPPAAIVTGNIALTDSSVFTVAGRTIGKIYWNSGSLPIALNMRYHSGIRPVSQLNQVGDRFNSYYEFLPTGAGVFNADVKLYYDSALFGSITNASSITMAAGTGLNWSNNASTTVDLTERSFRVNNLISLNLFTGTQLSNPLAIKLVKFIANTEHKDAKLLWQSASEVNAHVYEVQRSADGNKFMSIGEVKALGKASSYSFKDFEVFAHTNKVFYRLKMVDNNGNYEYSNVIVLQNAKSNSLNAIVYPNPYTSATCLSFNSDTEQSANVTVSDIQGKTVWSKTIHAQTGTNTISLDLMNLNTGIYFVNLLVNETTYQTKIVK
jgi:hypothetical protein